MRHTPNPVSSEPFTGFWIDTPDALALLADIAKVRPKLSGLKDGYGHDLYDRWDERVSGLVAVSSHVLSTANDLAIAGNREAFNNWRGCPSVDDVIRCAIAGWPITCVDDDAEARRQAVLADVRRAA